MACAEAKRSPGGRVTFFEEGRSVGRRFRFVDFQGFWRVWAASMEKEEKRRRTSEMGRGIAWCEGVKNKKRGGGKRRGRPTSSAQGSS